MTELIWHALWAVTLGLALVLTLRRVARRLFGVGPAFALWALPLVLGAAACLPHGVVPAQALALPAIVVSPSALVAGAGDPSALRVLVAALPVAWWLGVAYALVRLARGYVRLLRAGAPVSRVVGERLAELAPDIDLHRVRIHAVGPAVLWALPRSRVLLPPDFATGFADRETRALVLAHELAHLRRLDAWWTLAMALAAALLWFHPLVWLARSRFRLDQELACDAAVVRAAPGGTSRYAQALLDSAAVRPAPAMISWLTEPQLKERIVMLAKSSPSAFRRRVGAASVALLLASGAYVAGARPPAGASSPAQVDVTFKNAHPPAYPTEAIHQGEQGKVVMDVALDAAGRVMRVTVDRQATTAPAVLQQAAVAAAQGWKFRPAVRGGHPAAATIKVPVTFALDGDAHGSAPIK
jgi:TonB family protein